FRWTGIAGGPACVVTDKARGMQRQGGSRRDPDTNRLGSAPDFDLRSTRPTIRTKEELWRLTMREDGKLDYLEMQAGGGTIDSVKAFYSAAFGWTFTDYGPSYSAYEEGLDGGFDGSSPPGTAPLPVIYAQDLEKAAAAVIDAGGKIVRPI